MFLCNVKANSWFDFTVCYWILNNSNNCEDGDWKKNYLFASKNEKRGIFAQQNFKCTNCLQSYNLLLQNYIFSWLVLFICSISDPLILKLRKSLCYDLPEKYNVPK